LNWLRNFFLRRARIFLKRAARVSRGRREGEQTLKIFHVRARVSVSLGA
jgi:hypothetical protein